MDSFSKFRGTGKEVKKDKSELKRQVEAALNKKEKQIMPIKQSQDAENIATSSKIGDSGKEKAGEGKKPPFKLDEIHRWKKELNKFEYQLNALMNEKSLSQEDRQAIFLGIGHQLIHFERSGAYERTKQFRITDNKLGKAMNAVGHGINKISEGYREKNDAGKEVRKLWRDLSSKWLNYNKQLDTQNDLAELDGKDFEIDYPRYNNFQQESIHKASIRNMLPDKLLQEIRSNIQNALEQSKQNDGTEKIAMLKLDNNEISEYLHLLYEQIIFDAEQCYDVKSRISQMKNKPKMDSHPLYVEAELQDLALGKNWYTLRLLQSLESEKSPTVCHELMEKVVEICNLSVYRYHKKYNHEVSKAASNFNECYKEFKEYFNPFIKREGYGIEEYLSNIPEGGRKIAADRHIRDVFEPYKKLVDSLKEFKSSIGLFSTSYSDNTAKSIILLIDKYNIHEKAYNELLQETEDKALYKKKYEEVLKKLKGDNKDPFDFKTEKPLIDRHAFEAELLPYLISAYETKATIELLTRKALYGEDLQVFSSPYVTNPYPYAKSYEAKKNLESLAHKALFQKDTYGYDGLERFVSKYMSYPFKD